MKQHRFDQSLLFWLNKKTPKHLGADYCSLSKRIGSYKKKVQNAKRGRGDPAPR